jgi:hypothetical protein
MLISEQRDRRALWRRCSRRFGPHEAGRGGKFGRLDDAFAAFDPEPHLAAGEREEGETETESQWGVE